MEPQSKKQLIKQYWSKASELYNQQKHIHSRTLAEQASTKIKMYRQLGRKYLQIVLAEEGVMIEDYNSCIKQLGFELKLSDIPLDLIVGMGITGELKNNNSIKKIVKCIRDRDSSQQVTKNTIDLSDSEEDEQQNNNFYNLMKKCEETEDGGKVSQQTKQTFDESMNDISINFGNEEDGDNDVSLNIQEVEYDRDDFEITDPEVYDHLVKLSKATTELSYLCQHMKWSQPHYTQKISELNPYLYSAHMEVLVRAKHGKGVVITGECMAAQSKKEARRVAALFILRKIYYFIPQVWRQYKKICEKHKGIQQPMNANNQEIFNKAKLDVLNLGVFKQPMKKQKNKIDKKINDYLDKIISFKNQLNLLIGKNKKISPPNFKREKQDDLGLWPVEVDVYYDQKQIKAEAKDSSKKKAEEKASRELLFQIFKSDPQGWEEFVKHKQSKNLP